MENYEIEITKNEIKDEGKKYGRRNKRKIFWGIVLVLGTVALLANKLGFREEIGFWPIVLSIGLAGIFIDGILKRSFGEMMFALAFLIIVNDELLHMEAITPWPVLIAAIAITAGLNMLFPKFGRHHGIHVRGGSSKTVNEENRDGDTVSYETRFGSTVKYITGEVTTVNMSSSFGAMEVYFNDAVLKNGTASVHVEVSFGSVVLYVPAGWRVLMSVDTAFGAAEETGHCDPTGENVLYVDGEVSFGGLEIKHI